MQSARDYIAARDDRAAAIQLRNALQQQPRNAEARFLLGQVLARTGDFLGAEKELRRALEYGYPADRVSPRARAGAARDGTAAHGGRTSSATRTPPIRKDARD